MRILRWYIRQEFIIQFFICFFGFLVLGIGKIFFDYNDMFIGYRVTPQLMCFLVVNQIPTLIMDILPAAVLFGVILSIGRFLRERELDVIRLSGASLFRISFPIIVFVSFMCFVAYWWNDLVVPASNQRFQKEVRRLSLQEDLPLLKENVVIKAPENRFIFLRNIKHKEGEISGVMIIEAGQPGKWPRVITADHGKLRRGVWELYNGIIHEMDSSGAIISELRYQKMDLKMVNDFSMIIGDEKTPSTMRTGELRQYYELSRRSGINSAVYAVYYHQKFADPLISLVLAILAFPLTIMTGRNSRWIGLVLCFLIIMAYYTMQVIGRTMGSNNVLIPWVAAWVPHIVFIGIGILMFMAIEQRR